MRQVDVLISKLRQVPRIIDGGMAELGSEMIREMYMAVQKNQWRHDPPHEPKSKYTIDQYKKEGLFGKALSKTLFKHGNLEKMKNFFLDIFTNGMQRRFKVNHQVASPQWRNVTKRRLYQFQPGNLMEYANEMNEGNIFYGDDNKEIHVPARKFMPDAGEYNAKAMAMRGTIYAKIRALFHGRFMYRSP